MELPADSLSIGRGSVTDDQASYSAVLQFEIRVKLEEFLLPKEIYTCSLFMLYINYLSHPCQWH